MGNRVTLSLRLLLLVVLTAFMTPLGAFAQGDQAIYTDSLQNGWQNWSWATVNEANTTPVHSGARSFSVTAGAYQALSVHHTAFSSAGYTGLTFWVNGGAAGGQSLIVVGTLNGTAQTGYHLPALSANVWRQVTIPLTTLGVSGVSNLDGFWLQSTSGGAQPTFYVDDITLTHAPLPTSAHLSVNAAQTVRTLDGRVYGLNTAIWDGYLGTPASASLLSQIQTQMLRYPGGSASDAYNWSTNMSDGQTYAWASSTPTFAALAAAVPSQACITVNYGSGTPEMATAWVAYANGSPFSTVPIGVDAYGRDWHTVGYWAGIRAATPRSVDDGYNFLRVGHPAPFGFHYWEIGNECYGTWENDQHGVVQTGGATPLTGAQWDAYTYAGYAAQFIREMKVVDPTIKIGVVGLPGEDSNGNSQHAVPNPSEGGALHSGWTPVALVTLRALGVTPDFLIYHRYPESPASENDYGLLTDSGGGWPAAAADLRAMLTNYFGTGSGSIELVVTENNSVYGDPGKQSVSLVNGLYMADSIGSLSQTEFNGLFWWDFRNGADTTKNNSPALYGSRLFGDYGIVSSGNLAGNPVNTPYPAFYAAKLLTHWARGGDQIVSAVTDDARLAVYAARLQSGSLALLVINKDATHDLTGHVAISGYAPSGQATIYSYGKPQDLANADLAQTTIANGSPSFDYLFPSYSMTVIGLASAATPPTIVNVAAVNPSPVAGTTAALSVLGTDPHGEAGLTYIWTATGPAPVTFTPNATNAAKTANATFTAAGTYTLTVTATNPVRLTAQSNVTVVVQQTPAVVTVSPNMATLAVGAGQTFAAAVTDQFGTSIASPAVAWTVTSGGTISAGGMFTAGTSFGSPVTVTATSGSVHGTASVSISAPIPLVNRASFVSQSVPSAMTAGQSYPVSVTYQNTGTTTWNSATLYRLGSQSPADNATWTPGNRVLLPSTVAPGQSVTFAFTVTAPASAGTYPFGWRMVQDGVQWFGDFTPVQSISIN